MLLASAIKRYRTGFISFPLTVTEPNRRKHYITKLPKIIQLMEVVLSAVC